MTAYLDAEVLVTVDLLLLAKYLENSGWWRCEKEKGEGLTG